MQATSTHLTSHGQKKRPSGLYLEQCLRLAQPSDCNDTAQILAFLGKARIDLVDEDTLSLAEEQVRALASAPAATTAAAVALLSCPWIL